MSDKKIRCCSCGKPIAEEISIQVGYVKITCRCGTVNEIKAQQKEQVPYGERIGYSVKGPFSFTCMGEPIDANGVVLRRESKSGK
jgi:phage FluMu protein Com